MMITFKQFLSESLPFTKNSLHTYSFEVDGQKMEVMIDPYDGEISFGFPHKGMSRFETTGQNKNQFKIINTVANIVNQHVKNMPSGTEFMFVGNGKKADLYTRLLKKFRADRDWIIDTKDHGYGVSFRLEKK